MHFLSPTSALFMVLLTVGTVAQLPRDDSDAALARLSYESGGTVIDWRDQKGFPKLCLAVYQSGYYQVSRLTEHGNQTLEGTMSKEQLGELHGLLHQIDFPSRGGGIQYLQGAESIVIELLGHGKTKHHFWINPANRNPLPKSAIKVVNWLENFEARNATPLQYEASDLRICPSMNDNPLPLKSSLKSGPTAENRGNKDR